MYFDTEHHLSAKTLQEETKNKAMAKPRVGTQADGGYEA